ncbi:MAG: PrsW family glutamic-type intramembrane protease, partial [Nocardioides sp.]
SRVVRVLAPLIGFGLAVLAHAAWNSSSLFGLEGFVGVYFVLMVPAFIVMLCLAIWWRKSERRMLAATLHDAARRGLIPATDIDWVVHLSARREARAFARQKGGKPAEQAMQDYQQALIELGFLHYRYLRGTAPDDFAARGQAYVDRINAVRPYVAFPGQVVPHR